MSNTNNNYLKTPYGKFNCDKSSNIYVSLIYRGSYYEILLNIDKKQYSIIEFASKKFEYIMNNFYNDIVSNITKAAKKLNNNVYIKEELS